jgi:uncharacterized protein (TIGR02145 family)
MKSIKSGFSLVILIFFFALNFIACNEKVTDPASLETDSITDIDGNIYKTVKIGSKWWMAENLKVSRYNNGDSIIYISQTKPDSEWSNLKTGAYCYFDKNFGFLYNFYTITDSRKIAPAGWHIPTDAEWKELELSLGMSTEDTDKLNWRGTDQGDKLKIANGNSTYWLVSSDIYFIAGTNESGFTALPGACRIFNGQWGDITHTGFWWSSSVNGNEAWYRGLDYNKANVFRFSGPGNYGFSVRCVKD